MANAPSSSTNACKGCSGHCSVNVGAIPQELRDLPQWVIWRLVQRNGKSKPTKVPINPITSLAASTTDRTTWVPFDEALAAHLSGQGHGIGFVFAPDDPYTGIDLDECYDDAGDLAEWAQDLVTRFDSYTELSPSGRGLHLIIRASLPERGRRRGSIEMYSEGRYFTMTGALLEGASSVIAERPEILDAVYKEVFAEGDNQWTSQQAPIAPPNIEGDDDLITRACEAKNGANFQKLWQGDWSDYGSQSEADLALCRNLHFWTSGDPHRMDRLFRQSKLYRDKWDEMHGKQTYGEMTVAKACSGPVIDPAKSTNPKDELNTFPLTDAGNAELFANLYGHELRYDHARNRWLIWDKHRWAPDSDGEVHRLAKKAARVRYQAALNIEDLDLRGKTASSAVRSESRQRLDACLALARSEHPIADSGMDWDTDPYLLGVANGVVDLRTGLIRPGHPEDRLTMQVPVEYDVKSECPRWEQFLHQVFECDSELIGFMQRAVGYSLTGSVREQVLFLCYGTGSNGKSVFLNMLRHLAGDYAQNIPFTVLELQQRPSLTNDLAAMAGKRLVTSSETNESTRLNEARIKALTGGDPITARFLYSESFTYEPVAKFWLAVNHLPQVRDDSHGFWRRVRVLPFKALFKGEDADQELALKLSEELPGILNWSVQGALNWQSVGLAPPPAVMTATDAYRKDNDELDGFFTDRCVVADGAKVEPGHLFSEYQRWAQEQGILERQRLGSRSFGTRIRERVGDSVSSNGKRHYLGIGLKAAQ